MRGTAVITTTDGDKRPGTRVPPSGAQRGTKRRTMGLCAHCQRPIEFDQQHLRVYRLFWHVECALAAHEPATE